jgi:hypothetical protein
MQARSKERGFPAEVTSQSSKNEGGKMNEQRCESPLSFLVRGATKLLVDNPTASRKAAESSLGLAGNDSF